MHIPRRNWLLRYVLQNDFGGTFGGKLPIKSVDGRDSPNQRNCPASPTTVSSVETRHCRVSPFRTSTCCRHQRTAWIAPTFETWRCHVSTDRSTKNAVSFLFRN